MDKQDYRTYDAYGHEVTPPEVRVRLRRREQAYRLAAQLGIDGDALHRAAEAVWSNLNPQSVPFTTALSVAGVALKAAGQAYGAAGAVSVTHTGMAEHDGYAAHSHEVRPDHQGVPRG